jgi:hypothetical protein
MTAAERQHELERLPRQQLVEVCGREAPRQMAHDKQTVAAMVAAVMQAEGRR